MLPQAFGSVVSRWRRAALGFRTSSDDEAVESSAETLSCPNLAKALERLARRADQAEVLDLGPLCGPTAVFLADRGARVSVEEFRPPDLPLPPNNALDEPPPPPPLAIRQPEGSFDLVLAWEHGDFVPPARLGEFARELRRLLRPGGGLLLLAGEGRFGDAHRLERPGRFRVLSEQRVVRVPLDGPPRARWVHSTRALERALAPLSVQGIHLSRNGLREFFAVKRAR